LIVIDVGHSIETYADFTGTGKHYAQFPDTNSFRILLPELTREEVRDRLREFGSTRCPSIPAATQRRSRAKSPRVWHCLGAALRRMATTPSGWHSS
jgi:hypothetical protein